MEVIKATEAIAALALVAVVAGVPRSIIRLRADMTVESVLAGEGCTAYAAEGFMVEFFSVLDELIGVLERLGALDA